MTDQMKELCDVNHHANTSTYSIPSSMTSSTASSHPTCNNLANGDVDVRSSRIDTRISIRQSKKYQLKWIPSQSVSSCQICLITFDLFHRRHHCRNCGHVVCSACSPHRRILTVSKRKKRVCGACFDVYLLHDAQLLGTSCSAHFPQEELERIENMDTVSAQVQVPSKFVG